MSEESSIIQIPYRWEPRLYQDECWIYFDEGGKRACVCWHRRAGKDLFAINLIAKKMMERPGLYWHAFPTQLQGRKTIWDGVTKDGRPFLDHFPGYRNPGAPDSLVETIRQDLMQVKFKATRDPVTLEMRETGGIYQVVGLDEPDSLVGPNPFGIVFSEWSLCPERAWHLFKPMLNENGGWALFIFTMRGRNHAYKMLKRATENMKVKFDEPAPKKWFAQLLTVEDTYQLEKTTEVDEETKEPVYVPRAVVTQERIQEDREDGMPEETIQSEYYGSADAPIPGSYYGDIINTIEKRGQICSVPHDPHADVITFWDIGHDSTDIIAAQPVGMEMHIINFYGNSGEGMPHYANVLRKWERELGYVFGTHYGPHDLSQREFMAGGKTKLEIAGKLGVKFRIVQKHSLEDGIEETRGMLHRCWFDKKNCVDEKHNKGLVDALRAYCKEYDEKKEVFKETPRHDWASHPSDALRQGAMGYRHKMEFRKRNRDDMNKAKTNYNELTY